MRFFKLLFALSFVGFLFFTTYVYFELKPKSIVAEKVIIVVEPGPFKKVTDELYEKKLISNKRFFEIIVRFLKADQKLKTGEYELATNMWPQEILRTLSSGKSIQRSFTIQEGLNLFEIGRVLEEKGITTREEFLNYVTNPKTIQNLAGIKAKSLEGYLYPDTYFYTKNMSMEKIVQMMVDHFNRVIDDVAPQLQSDKERRHKMIILASMIEKETGAPEERVIISSVFYNRMKKGMKLQSDPTVIYGIAIEKNEIIKNIKKSDLLKPTPYNTYTIKSLPVGPIANPGKDAIVAALQPEKTEYLYFVSMNEGRHYFSRSYEEHALAVKDYQINRKAREGKSWRNLKQKQ